MRRDALPRLGALRFKMPDGLKVAMPVRLGLSTPTREVGPPGDAPETRRFTGRVRAILTTAVIAAVLVNAGVAWTYWRVAEADTVRAPAGPAIEMAPPARSDLNRPLAPGRRGDLLVTLINNHDFPVRITSVSRGPGKVMADDEHRDAGCTDPVVELTQGQFAVRWDVQKNMIGAFTIPDGLVRGADDDMACAGAVFTIPIQATGAGQS